MSDKFTILSYRQISDARVSSSCMSHIARCLGYRHLSFVMYSITYQPFDHAALAAVFISNQSWARCRVIWDDIATRSTDILHGILVDFGSHSPMSYVG